jgi:hypothetical protein
MDSNEEVVQKRVVVDRGDQRSEVLSESSQRVVKPSGISTTTTALIVFLVVIAAAIVIYMVSSRNAQRQEDLAASNQPSPVTIVQQPAPAPAPVIIQQAAPIQPTPAVVQQPAQAPVERELTSANEDAGMQDVATKRLKADLDLGGVVATVNDARAVLTGAVGSEEAKAKAEQIVKGVRGVKSVDNKIVVPS